ncbi:MAG: hypothetical protein ACWGHH_06530 [Sulfurovaceae bacterium]
MDIVSATSTFSGALGWQESGLYKGLFATLYSRDEPNIQVRGKVVSCSISDNQNWESPFEEFDDKGMFGTNGVGKFVAWLQSGGANTTFDSNKHKDLLEKFAQKTLVTKMQSLQIWSGSQPRVISMTLNFHAFRDANREVTMPVAALQRMALPSLKENGLEEAKKAFQEIKNADDKQGILNAITQIPSKTPPIITCEYLGKSYNDGYIIDTVDVSWDKAQLDSRGNFIDQDVQISLKSRYSLSQENI